MRVLRALNRPLFGEMCSPGDVNDTIPREIVVVACRPCENSQADGVCLCRRAFFGTFSGRVTTMAVIEEMDRAAGLESCLKGTLAQYWWGEHAPTFAPIHLERMAGALDHYEVGDILRVRWENNRAMIYRLALIDEEAALSDLYSIGDRLNEG